MLNERSYPSAAAAEVTDQARIRLRVISLAGAQARRAAVSQNLSGSAFEWSFLDAETGSYPGLRYDEDEALRLRGRRLLPSEIGCFQSHWRLWKEVAEGDGGWMLIMEDDHVLDTGFPFAHVARQADKAGIPLLRLSYCFLQPSEPLGFIGMRQLLRFRHGPSGLGCYLLSRDGARRLLEAVKRIVRPVDDEVDRYFEHGLPILGLFPFPSLDLGRGRSTISGRAERLEQPLTPRQRGAYFRQRVRDKLAKELAHRRMRSADRALRAKLAEIQTDLDRP